MFIGEYSHSLDAKGRLIVPAKFREELGEHFIMTKGIDKCLYIYPRSEWEIFENKLRLPMPMQDDLHVFSCPELSNVTQIIRAE